MTPGKCLSILYLYEIETGKVHRLVLDVVRPIYYISLEPTPTQTVQRQKYYVVDHRLCN